MTDPRGDLEARVAALEERLGMEAGLRASADRDLSDLRQSARAHTYLVQALAITQSQHGEALTDLARGVEVLTGNVETLRVEHGARLAEIVGLLTRLINRPEA